MGQERTGTGAQWTGAMGLGYNGTGVHWNEDALGRGYNGTGALWDGGTMGQERTGTGA